MHIYGMSGSLRKVRNVRDVQIAFLRDVRTVDICAMSCAYSTTFYQMTVLNNGRFVVMP